LRTWPRLSSEALAIAGTRVGPPIALPGYLAWIRVSLAADDGTHPDRIEAVLQRALDLVEETGARRWESELKAEADRLADRLGDRHGGLAR
jgi:hypothetical protein